MKLSLVDETKMPPCLDDKIREGLCTCFPPDAPVFSRSRAWHGSTPEYSVVLEDEDLVIAHVGVVGRTIAVGGTPLRVAGVQNVYVLPEYRGKHLSTGVMRAAMTEAAHRDLDCGLLFCVPSLERVYASCGWQNLGRRRVVRVEHGREVPIPDKNIAMFHPIRVTAFPDGLIHLCGNDW
jgi:predicted N-acetyltransferase YhbS